MGLVRSPCVTDHGDRPMGKPAGHATEWVMAHSGNIKDMRAPVPFVASVDVPVGMPTDARFDRWLGRRLHEAYDSVLREALPPELERLVQAFAAKSDGNCVSGSAPEPNDGDGASADDTGIPDRPPSRPR